MRYITTFFLVYIIYIIGTNKNRKNKGFVKIKTTLVAIWGSLFGVEKGVSYDLIYPNLVKWGSLI